jgi:uncharacterized protein YcfL
MYKKIIFLMVLIFMISGCNPPKTEEEIKNIAQTQAYEFISQTQAAWTPTPRAYTSPEGVEVLFCFTSGSRLGIVFQNNTNDIVKDIEYQYRFYDENGLPVSDHDMSMNTDNLNILPGEKKVYITFLKALGYAKVAIREINFYEIETRYATNIDVWLEEAQNPYSYTEYLDSIPDFSALAREAEQSINISLSPEIALDSLSLRELRLKIENYLPHTITNGTFILMQFDINGNPVDTSSTDIVENERNISIENTNIAPMQSEEFGWRFIIQDQTESIKLLPLQFEFSDGTSWKNEYYIDWIFYNYFK